MHWEHKQVTLHPTVAYFKCPTSICDKISTHEVVHISDDPKHDAHIVKRFNEKTISVLKKRGIPIHKIIQFTDQAPSQYKNKLAFKYMCECKIPYMMNFFGVRHGKGPCDGCAGRVKQQITSLVKTEKVVINSAASFFKACKNHLQKDPQQNGCSHYAQTFEFTNKLNNRPNTGKWPGIPETHKIHSLIHIPGTKIVHIRNWLCTCNDCVQGTGNCTNNVYPQAWRAYSIAKWKAVKPDLRKWCISSEIIDMQNSTRALTWEDRVNALTACNSYAELHTYVSQNPLPGLECNISLNMSQQDMDQIDFVALHYSPSDAPASCAPVCIIGDGNCFPRTLSYILFRTQDRHLEMRTRIVYEACLNKNHYLNNDYISKGANHQYARATLVEQFAQYADCYVPSVGLNVERIYEQEVMDMCKNNSYMGIWQIFQSANVIRQPIRSVYPEGYNNNIRLDLNRAAYCYTEQHNQLPNVNIMWTPTQVANHSPCHFVPLLEVVRELNFHVSCNK